MKIEGERAVYHCVSRAVNREMLFHDGAKETLRRQIWQVADFSGVEVIAYCVMSNHFHILIRVPDAQEAGVSDIELMRRYRVLYTRPTRYQVASPEVLEQMLRKGGKEAAQFRASLLRRMHDVSEFMKTLKQRFSIWYNRFHGRVGTLWAERYRSTIVEESDRALSIVSAYIDLNPMRAGLVNDPKDYRWSSYGEAMGGSPQARSGLTAAVNGRVGRDQWNTAATTYRTLLYCKGTSPSWGKGSLGVRIPVHSWRNEMERGGELPVSAALRCRVRYFTDGAILGSHTFVEAKFHDLRARFGANRTSGARKMRGSAWNGLMVMRDLRKEVFGPAETLSEP